MSNLPTLLPSIQKITDPFSQAQKMNSAGFEIDLLHNQIASELEELAAMVGVTNSAVTSTIDYKVRVDLPASIAAAQAAAIAGAPVQSVAGRTGGITLSVSDVSGAAPAASPALTGVPTAPTASPGTSTTQVATTAFAGNAASAAQSAAIAACPAETTTTIGSLIAGAAEKTIISPSDKIALSDSASSGILKWGSTADILQALYLLGMPLTIFQSAIPFFLLPGDGGTNGMTFTGGGGGAFTLSAAPMANLLGGLSGRGCYGYLPANAGGSGCASGWYYFVPSSDTAGTFYADKYSGGQPQIVGSPTTFAGSPSGRITTPTSEITAISGINMTPFGNNGEAEWKIGTAGDTVSSNKSFRLRLGGTLALGNIPTTSPVSEMLLSLRNAGAQNIQAASRITASAVGGIGAGNNSINNGNFTAIDLSGATTAITMTMQLASNTGCMVLLSSSVTQKYRP